MYRKAFVVTSTSTPFIDPSVYLESIANGQTYLIQYTARINASVGDTVTILIDDEDNWHTVINERTGDAATVTTIRKC